MLVSLYIVCEKLNYFYVRRSSCNGRNDINHIHDRSLKPQLQPYQSVDSIFLFSKYPFNNGTQKCIRCKKIKIGSVMCVVNTDKKLQVLHKNMGKNPSICSSNLIIFSLQFIFTLTNGVSFHVYSKG